MPPLLLMTVAACATLLAHTTSGSTLHAQGRHREAEAAFRAELDEAERTRGAEDPETASIQHNLAATLHSLGRAAEAELLVRRAISTWEKSQDGSGDSRSRLAAALNNLGAMRVAQGDRVGAEALYVRALALIGQHAPEAAPVLTNLAASHAKSPRLCPGGRIAEASGGHIRTHTKEGQNMRLIALTVVLAIRALPATIVYPTGAFPTDVNNVQAAVNGGGVVLLKAVNTRGAPTAFNFGLPLANSGAVFLTVDVEIIGETVGPNITTITGGDRPFRAGAPAPPAPSPGMTPVRSAIKGIFFDGPRNAAFVINATKGATFSHNKVAQIQEGFCFPCRSAGVGAGGPGAQSGVIVVEDNVIEGSDADIGFGVNLSQIKTDARVARNIVLFTRASGVFVSRNTNPVVVEDNLIVPGFANDVDEGIRNGIEAAFPLGGSLLIRRNTSNWARTSSAKIWRSALGILRSVALKDAWSQHRRPVIPRIPAAALAPTVPAAVLVLHAIAAPALGSTGGSQR